MKPKFRLFVFLIPVGLLFAGLVFSMTSGESFYATLNGLNSGLLSKFGWLYSTTTLVVLIVCIAAMVSPFGRVRIGGRNARPKLGSKSVFAIVLCSIVGIGMVTWGSAEVMAHYVAPPVSSGIEGYTPQAADFAMQTVLLHWTFPAYALYALPSLIFAFIFYNMKGPYSVSSYLRPITGGKMNRGIRGGIDIVCIFSLLCGMVCTIGSTVLTVIGGGSYLSKGVIEKSTTLIGLSIATIVAVFVVSSISGVMKGIKLISNANLYIFIGLALFVFVFGPTTFILNYGVEGIGNFTQNFFSSMLRTCAVSGDEWPYWWSIFYWAAYMAWAPISAMFIGKVCYGQTVRRVLLLALILPSAFSGIWMCIFSGTSMSFELSGFGIADAYLTGYENTAYAVFEHLPLTLPVVIIFLFVAAISVITAAESATDALANLVFDTEEAAAVEKAGPDGRIAASGETVVDKDGDAHGKAAAGGEPVVNQKIVAVENVQKTETKKPFGIYAVKILFGLIIGGVTFLIVAFSDITGIKIISNIGAFPSMWIELIAVYSILKIMRNPGKYDLYKEDYDENGRPL